MPKSEEELVEIELRLSEAAVVRTRDHVRPLYISVGHRLDLPTAIDLVLECGGGYRLPEPTRLAHQAAGGTLKWRP